ncbi:MAG: MaoC family dehydratase [bacterium]|nr:MaoC family dehydratase [bacterium]
MDGDVGVKSTLPSWVPEVICDLVHSGNWMTGPLVLMCPSRTADFSEASRDFNPVHFSDEEARKWDLAGAVMHGMHLPTMLPLLMPEFHLALQADGLGLQDVGGGSFRFESSVPVGAKVWEQIKVTKHKLYPLQKRLRILFDYEIYVRQDNEDIRAVYGSREILLMH